MSPQSVSSKIADYLLQTQAVKLNTQQPFIWASGWNSPIYCDNRVTLSFPEIRSYIKSQLADLIKNKFPNVDAIAGVATAGIAQGALVAEALNLPFAYVRPEPKKHGMKNQIEGRLPKESKIVVIEDLISTGSSSIKAVTALREEGYHVMGLASIFTYGFTIAEQNFANAACPSVSLSNYNDLIEVALSKNLIEQSEIEKLKMWRTAPDIWGK